MPKEITHWTLAEKVFSALEKDSSIRDIIARGKNLYYLGAVIPDSPFYCIFGKRIRSVIQLGQNFHNNKMNGFQPVIEIIKAYKHHISREVWAFILGIVSHIIVDSTFHPFINFYSGNINNKKLSKRVRCRHRQLETFLDLFFKGKVELINHGLFSWSYQNKEMEESDFLRLVSLLYYGRPDGETESIKNVMKFHSWIQESFSKKWPRWVLGFVDFIPFLYMREKIALYYPQSNPIHSPFFQNPISFLHPVTGEKQKKSVDEMVTNVVKDTLNIFKKLDENRESLEAIDVLSTFQAPNLHTGMINTPAENMKFFDISDDITELVTKTETFPFNLC